MIQGLGGERVIDHYEWQGYLIILLEAAADKFRNPNELIFPAYICLTDCTFFFLFYFPALVFIR